MAAYSLDLRQKILSAWENKENTQRIQQNDLKLAYRLYEIFCVGIEKQMKQPRSRKEDRRSKIKGENEELVKTIIKKQNDIYLREIKDNLEESNGLKVSVSALSRTVKRLELVVCQAKDCEFEGKQRGYSL